MDELTVVSADRARGKTYALVEWLLTNPDKRVIVCSNNEQRRRILGMIEGHGVTPSLRHPRVVTLSEASKRLMGTTRDLEVAVDNIDELFSSMLGRQPTIVTLSRPVRTMSLPQLLAETNSS